MNRDQEQSTTNLDRFFQAAHESAKVIGTYLYPYCIFGEPDWNDPYSAIEIIAKMQVNSSEVLITRNGGLFVQPATTLTDELEPKLIFQEMIAHEFNRIICELALHGIVSEPATPAHISQGALVDNHALIISAGGGREMYLERTLMPSIHLHKNLWQISKMQSVDVLNKVTKQQMSSQLEDISDNLPTFVASAYSLFSRHAYSEALLDSWIVVEQIIDWLWKEYLANINDRPRKDRLSDTRTYSASVRIETLFTTNKIPLSLYEIIHTARKHRNELAHRAKINLDMAQDSLSAMKQVIEFTCQTTVEPPLANVGVTW